MVDSLWAELGILAEVRQRSARLKIEEFENVWDALESNPTKRAHLKLRSRLMEALRAKVGRWKLGRSAAAKRLKITPPRFDDLLKARFSEFSLGELIDLAVEAGLAISVSFNNGRVRPK